MPRLKPIPYSSEELAWIESNQAGVDRLSLASMFNAKFDRDVSAQNISGLCKRKGWRNGLNMGFKSGEVPWNKGTKGVMKPNKGTFKKGVKAHNRKPIGHERITKDGYIMVKVAEPKTFRLKHLLVWESHHGKVPKGHSIRFLDEERANCSIDNLMCVPQGVSMIVNNLNPANTKDKDLNKAILLTESINYHAARAGNRANQDKDLL